MINENSLEESFLETLQKKDILPEIIDLGDAGLNEISKKTELLGELPYIKVAYGVLKVPGAIRDFLLTKKIIRFLTQFRSLSDSERANMFCDLNGDPDERRKVGEHLLTILDKSESVEKADLLGKLFKYYCLGRMSTSEFLRNSIIVTNLITSDIRELPKYREEQEKKVYSAPLHSMGLLVRTSGFNNKGNDVEQDKYMISGLGKQLVEWLELE